MVGFGYESNPTLTTVGGGDAWAGECDALVRYGSLLGMGPTLWAPSLISPRGY